MTRKKFYVSNQELKKGRLSVNLSSLTLAINDINDDEKQISCTCVFHTDYSSFIALCAGLIKTF